MSDKTLVVALYAVLAFACAGLFSVYNCASERLRGVPQQEAVAK